MACNPRREPRCPARSSRAGFTLIELAITVVILAILATIGIANFVHFRKRAGYTSCISNQRHTLEAALLYISTASPGAASFDVSFLTGAGYLDQNVAECPSSTIDDFNDYVIDIVNNEVTLITCKVEPVDHSWALP